MIEYVYILTIKGMKCGMCESHVNNAIRNNFKIRKVISNRHKNETVIYSNIPLKQEDIKRVIDKTGYYFISLTCELKERKASYQDCLKRSRDFTLLFLTICYILFQQTPSGFQIQFSFLLLRNIH